MEKRKQRFLHFTGTYCGPNVIPAPPYFPTRQEFLDSCKTQMFSLPMPIIEYVIKNPSSPTVYEKLIKSCKWFFVENPILLLKSVTIDRQNRWKVCDTEFCKICNAERKQYGIEHQHFIAQNDQNKFWPSHRLYIEDYLSGVSISPVIQRFYRYNVQVLEIFAYDLTYEELSYLSKGVKVCTINRCIIRDISGQNIPLEAGIKLFAGAEKLTWKYSYLSPQNFCEDYERLVDACGAIKAVEINGVPGNFETLRFYDCLEAHKSRSIISIYGPDVDDDIFKTIVARTEFDFVPPIIRKFKTQPSHEAFEKYQRSILSTLN